MTIQLSYRSPKEENQAGHRVQIVGQGELAETVARGLASLPGVLLTDDGSSDDFDLIIDLLPLTEGERRCGLYRRARSQNKAVVAAFPTRGGATAYYFSPDSPIGFDELFATPPEDVRAGWRLPLSRLCPGDEPESLFHLFQSTNGIEEDRHSREAVVFLTRQLVQTLLSGGVVPQAPVACYLEPHKFQMGMVHLGKRMAEQADSIWTRIASVYDEFLLAAEDNVYRTLVHKVCQDLAGCERVLEAGCGTGNICLELARQGCQSYGIDRNLAMLARACHRATQTSGMYVAEGDVQRLYFPDEYFDGYCSNNVVFDADIVLTLQEAYRVLKPGGKLAIASSQISPNIEAFGAVPSYFEKLDAAVAREFVNCQKEIYAGRSLKYGFQTHGAQKVEQLLLDTGFTSILKSETVYAGHSFYLVAQK